MDTAHIFIYVGRANKDAVSYIISLGHRDIGRRCGIIAVFLEFCALNFAIEF